MSPSKLNSQINPVDFEDKEYFKLNGEESKIGSPS